LNRDWQGRRIWLTGASSGIGAALAERLAKEGAQLFLSGRKRAALEALGCGEVLPFDIRSPQGWNEAAAAIEKSGGIDDFLHCAGDCQYVDGRDYRAAPYRELMETNFLSLAEGLPEVLPLLRRGDSPRLILVSSCAPWFAFPRASAYNASKAALTAFGRCLRADLAAEGLEVALIHPGFVHTPLTAKNDFPMPFAISAEDAAARIERGLRQGRREIEFPRRFTWSLRILSCLPQRVQDAISAKLVRPRDLNS
jgi:NAD(P)-dependent dehydrogenase (short-subunit alcohol dehydrogenase family)